MPTSVLGTVFSIGLLALIQIPLTSSFYRYTRFMASAG